MFKDVCDPFLAEDWLPGVRESLVNYRQDPQNWRVEGWTGSQRWTDVHQEIRQRFLQGVDECRRKGESLSEATLRRLLGTGPPPGHESLGAIGARADHLLDGAARAVAWLGQAAAIAAWRSKVPTLVDRFEKSHQLRDDLKALTTALDQSCRDLQQDEARTGSRLDWAGRFCKHHSGLEAIRKQFEGGLHSALGGQAEALLAPLKGFDPFQRRTLEDVLARQPSDWPPRMLVELAEALDAARAWTGRNASGAHCWMIRLWKSPLEGSHGPPDTARRLLALTVLKDLDSLDSEAPLTAAAWAVAEKWLGLLLRARAWCGWWARTSRGGGGGGGFDGRWRGGARGGRGTGGGGLGMWGGTPRAAPRLDLVAAAASPSP